MEKSFTSWREPDKDLDDNEDSFQLSENVLVQDSASESESEVAASSPSKLEIPDSDESFTLTKRTIIDYDRNRKSFVPDSDDQVSSDGDDTNKSPSLSGPKPKPRRLSKKNSSYASNTSGEDKTPELSATEESSPKILGPAKRINKKYVISSDEENNSIQSANFNISDVFSEEENDRSTFTSKQKQKSHSHIAHNKSRKSNSESYEISESEGSPSNHALATSHSKIPIVDLTLPIVDSKTKESTDFSSNVSSFDNVKKKKEIINISSDSDEDKTLNSDRSSADENQLNVQLKKINLSNYDGKNLPSDDKKMNANAASNNQLGNDYSSRLESLKAEQTRLEVQVREVMKNIETIKSSLKTANIAVLPDKGVRLQINLKKFESKLRDLKYQQNTLSNEIIKLQFMPNISGVPKPIQLQPPQQKMFKLPTTTTNINEMGKRALETHRTQQALTVDALRGLHNSLKNCPSEDMLSSDPNGLKVELMPHQKYALSWLLWRESEKPSGGILADDMGLGKTLTMISLILKSNEIKHENSQLDDSRGDEPEASSSNWLASHRAKLIPGKTLVVCPASLLGQWEGEVQKRVQRGTVDVLVHHGQNREKRVKRLAMPDIVITTYNIVSRDADQSDSPLFQVKWERIILDEAHQIRNHKTKTAQAVFNLKGKSRWVLTGTPVQNKELDLYALLKFLRCAPFDDLGVWKTWVDNRDAAGKQRLNTIIKSIMLRRTKKGLQEVGELKNLPDKHLETVMVVMDKEEKAVYEKLLYFSKTLFATYLHQKAEKENALQGIPLKPHNLEHAQDPFKDHPELARLHRQMKQISDVKSHHILVLLLRLRQFCCHPSLVQTMLDKEDMDNVGIEDSDGLDIDLMEKMTRMSLVNPNQDRLNDPDLTAMDKDNPLFAKERISSKMRKVVETMDAILKSNDKVLIVSQWVTHLELLHTVLKEKKIKCTSLTGQIPVKDRAEIVDKFNQKNHGPRVMLLSLKAGGVGLNLVGANHLLLLDLHWNPQLENQAFDRIYRVGQEKNVQVYKFVTSDTVEEKVLCLQEKKLAVSDSVLTGAKKASSKLTLDDLKMLFKIN